MPRESGWKDEGRMRSLGASAEVKTAWLMLAVRRRVQAIQTAKVVTHRCARSDLVGDSSAGWRSRAF